MEGHRPGSLAEDLSKWDVAAHRAAALGRSALSPWGVPTSHQDAKHTLALPTENL